MLGLVEDGLHPRPTGFSNPVPVGGFREPVTIKTLFNYPSGSACNNKRARDAAEPFGFVFAVHGPCRHATIMERVTRYVKGSSVTRSQHRRVSEWRGASPGVQSV